MSTKTLRKRIALTAVAAMGLGLLSATSASAGAGSLTINTGTSVGVLGSSVTDDFAGTATLLSTGSLVINVEAGAVASQKAKLVVSAGAYIETVTAGTVAGNQLSVTAADSATAITGAKIRPIGAAGSTFTVTSYTSDATGAAAKNILTVTIAGASVAGTVSPTQSTVVWTPTNASITTSTSSVDSASSNETTTGKSLYLHVALRDAYGNSITSTTGALVVTASTGANTGISAAAGAATVTTFNTSVSAANPSDLSIIVGEATSGAGWSGTVTVTYNGTVVATKTGKITGNVAKLAVEVVKIGKNNGSASADAFRYAATDAAGNTIGLAAASVVFGSSSNASIIGTAVGTTASTSDTRGYGSFTCASSATGSVDLVLKTVLTNGTTISAPAVKASCGGTADSYAASLDKAKYAQGDVATLKVTFKDAKGALANSYDSVTNLAAANASISFPMAKQIGAISQADVTDVNGQVSYKFNIGDVASFSAGKYNAVVSFGTPANGAAQTVAYEVSGAGGVSNSDILSSIVKLITAINKQIAALQKLLLKK